MNISDNEYVEDCLSYIVEKENSIPFGNLEHMYWRARDFSEMDLNHASFAYSNLQFNRFVKSNLRCCDFSFTDCKNCTFVGANLSGVDFSNSDLTNVDFTGANIEGAIFTGAIVENITGILTSSEYMALNFESTRLSTPFEPNYRKQEIQYIVYKHFDFYYNPEWNIMKDSIIYPKASEYNPNSIQDRIDCYEDYSGIEFGKKECYSGFKNVWECIPLSNKSIIIPYGSTGKGFCNGLMLRRQLSQDELFSYNNVMSTGGYCDDRKYLKFFYDEKKIEKLLELHKIPSRKFTKEEEAVRKKNKYKGRIEYNIDTYPFASYGFNNLRTDIWTI